MKNKKPITIVILLAGTLLVLILVCALCHASYSNRQSTRLYEEGRKAFQQGQYDEAFQSLQKYLAFDPNHEDSWKMLAEIDESRGHWFQAAMSWQRLSRLNVLEEAYVRKYVNASYRCHYYEGLFNFFEKSDSKWQSEFQGIYALSAFKTANSDEKTTKLIGALSPDTAIARLIKVLKNRGPAEELAKLESTDDPVIQVEAFILDGYIAEFKDKDLKRAENCFQKAAEINPFVCQGEYGDYLFRNKRYKEAYEAYSRNEDALLSTANFLNYAETAYAQGNSDELEQIGKKLHDAFPKSIFELAYVHALKAHLDGDVERMKANYIVANQQRRTPMSMRLNFAVAIANNDIKLMTQAIKYLATSPSFSANRAQILPQLLPILQANTSNDHLELSAQLAEMFIDVEPANELVWKIVIRNKWNKKTLSPEMLNKAIELFPSEAVYRQLALIQTQGNVPAACLAFDQWIAVSKEPTLIRFRKADFLQRNGKQAEATAEITKMAESDTSLQAQKLCLIYGLRNTNKSIIELAGKCNELKSLSSFELERLYGNKDEATRILRSTRLEDAFTAKQIEDRPILLSLAVYLAIIHEIDRSIAVYEQLKPYSTSDATVELNLSELYASKGEKAQALDNAQSALRRFPNSRLVRAIYGLRCAENADFTTAITYLPETIQDTRLNGALAYCLEKIIADDFENGHFFVVRKQLEHLRKVRPDSPVIEEYTKKLAEQEAKSNK